MGHVRFWYGGMIITVLSGIIAAIVIGGILEMTKEDATLFILKVLSSRMAVLSNPMRQDALDLANEHGITVKDLIRTALERAENV